jgi:hypothetical protein
LGAGKRRAISITFVPVHFNLLTRMRVHLTGNSEGDIRVEKCGKVPTECRAFNQNERDTKATVERQKRFSQIARIKILFKIQCIFHLKKKNPLQLSRETTSKYGMKQDIKVHFFSLK